MQGNRAAQYTLLHYTPQLAGLPQDAVLKRVQTPQVAGLVQPGVLPSDGGTPQVAGVVSIPIKIPEDNIHGLHALLALLQVKANDNVPLYWYRAEHTSGLRALCSDTEHTVDEIAERLRGSGRDFTRIRSIDDLAMALN